MPNTLNAPKTFFVSMLHTWLYAIDLFHITHKIWYILSQESLAIENFRFDIRLSSLSNQMLFLCFISGMQRIFH